MYNRGSNFQDMIDGLEHDRNGGYSPALSTTVTPMRSAATSSKAVLTALRALQDKISRLESEKTDALEESARLRLQIQNQDMTSERYKQRDNLTSQKNLHEVRTAYDRILSEKSETEIRLSKLDERNRAEEKIAIELRAKIRAVEDEKHTGLLTIKDLESERTQLQSQILHIHQKEKDLTETVMWETKCREEDMDVLSNKLLSLQNNLSNLSHEKSVVQAKLTDLDQLVGQLLLTNESLVARLSNRHSVAAQPSSSNQNSISRKSKYSQSNNFPNNSAHTLLSSASFRDKGDASNYSSHAGSLGSTQPPEHLQNMHRMYVDLAKNITGESGSDQLHSGLSNSDQRMGTLMSRRGEKGNASSFASQYHEPEYEENDRSEYESHNLSQSRDFTAQDNGDAFESFHDGYSSSFIRGGNSPNTGRGRDRDRDIPEKEKDLQGVISSLEEEFNVLNYQYRQVLSNITARVPGSEIPQETELVHIIQKLHKKGEQLRTLKSPHK